MAILMEFFRPRSNYFRHTFHFGDSRGDGGPNFPRLFPVHLNSAYSKFRLEVIVWENFPPVNFTTGKPKFLVRFSQSTCFCNFDRYVSG